MPFEYSDLFSYSNTLICHIRFLKFDVKLTTAKYEDYKITCCFGMVFEFIR